MVKSPQRLTLVDVLFDPIHERRHARPHARFVTLPVSPGRHAHHVPGAVAARAHQGPPRIARAPVDACATEAVMDTSGGATVRQTMLGNNITY
jgi:hypothetical protein